MRYSLTQSSACQRVRVCVCVVVVVVVVVVMAVAHPTPLLTASSLAICRMRLINTSKWDWLCRNVPSQCWQNRFLVTVYRNTLLSEDLALKGSQISFNYPSPVSLLPR